MRQTKKANPESGATSVEFIIVFPLFLTMMLLTIEFALIAVDRSLLTAGSLSASRYLTLENFDPSTDTILYDHRTRTDTVACDTLYSQRQMQNARRRAALKMSVTAPSIGMVGALFGITLPAMPMPDALKNFARVVSGYPMAYILTRIQNCNITPQGVEIEMTYHRHPKIPFAGRIVWAIHQLNFFNSRMNGVLEADLKADMMGIGLSSPRLAQVRNRIVERIEGFAEIGNSITEINEALDQSILGPLIEGSNISETATKLSSEINRFANEAKTTVDKAYNSAVSEIREQETLATRMLYAIPDILRTVPFNRRVFLAWPGTFRRESSDNWAHNGTNILVAPYMAGTSNENLGVTTWTSWAQTLASSDYDWK